MQNLNEGVLAAGNIRGSQRQAAKIPYDRRISVVSCASENSVVTKAGIWLSNTYPGTYRFMEVDELVDVEIPPANRRD